MAMARVPQAPAVATAASVSAQPWPRPWPRMLGCRGLGLREAVVLEVFEAGPVVVLVVPQPQGMPQKCSPKGCPRSSKGWLKGDGPQGAP